MDSTTVGVIGAAYGMALGAGIWRMRRTTPADSLLAALWITIAIAIAAIVGQHDPRLAALHPILDRVDLTAALIAGPLLFFYCRGRALRAADLLHFVPACVSLVVELPVGGIVAYQIAYTVAAAMRERRSILILFAAVHVAQLVRFFWSEVVAIRNVVPVVGTAGILAFGLVLTFSRMSGKRYRKSALAADDALRTIERLDELMRTAAAYRDPSLSLPALAERLGVTAHHLSQALNEHRGTTLVDYLATFRVEEARRQLLDPARDHVTIDAIAESAGFGSRSAFYTAFRRLAGVPPSALRRRAAGSGLKS
jgi:AraC-like DNA-binding protein